jgi:hypothetical protein
LFALDDPAVKVAITLNGAGVGVVVGTVRRVPGVGNGVANTIGAEVEVETVADDVATAPTVRAGWEVLLVRGIAPMVVAVSVDAEIPAALDGRLGCEVAPVLEDAVTVDGVVTGVVDGVVRAIGAGVGTKPGNRLGGVGAPMGPTVGEGLATEGKGMGVGAGTDWEAEMVLDDVSPPTGVGLGLGLGLGPALDDVVFGRM